MSYDPLKPQQGRRHFEKACEEWAKLCGISQKDAREKWKDRLREKGMKISAHGIGLVKIKNSTTELSGKTLYFIGATILEEVRISLAHPEIIIN